MLSTVVEELVAVNGSGFVNTSGYGYEKVL
jgi:hypothetical protein